MIIQDTIIRPNGTIEVVDVEVADNYFDPPEPPAPTEAEKLRADVDFILASMGEEIEPEKIEAYRDAGLWTAERVQVAEELIAKDKPVEEEIGGRK